MTELKTTIRLPRRLLYARENVKEIDGFMFLLVL